MTNETIIKPDQPLVESTPRQILMLNKEFLPAYNHVEQTLQLANIKGAHETGQAEIRIKLGTVLPVWIPKAILHLYRQQGWAVFMQDNNPHELIFNFY